MESMVYLVMHVPSFLSLRLLREKEPGAKFELFHGDGLLLVV
jgi:hypothetical protein